MAESFFSPKTRLVIYALASEKPLRYSTHVYRTDYHTHTPLCHHAEGEPEAFVERALQLGLREYGISDHAPMPRADFDDWRMSENELHQYFQWVEKAKEAARGTDLIVRVGLECDWIQGIEKWIEHLKTLYDWDYLIGSVHYLGNGWAFDDPRFADKTFTGSLYGDWQLYWKNYEAMVYSGLFDIYGHADLIRKWGKLPSEDWISLADGAISAMQRQGGIMEINTAGFHTAAQSHYPHPTLLLRTCEAGIPIMINSDAHAPDILSRDFDVAVQSAIQAGYTYITLPGQRQFALEINSPS